MNFINFLLFRKLLLLQINSQLMLKDFPIFIYLWISKENVFGCDLKYYFIIDVYVI